MRLGHEPDTSISGPSMGRTASVFPIGQARVAGMSAMPEPGSQPEGAALPRVANVAQAAGSRRLPAVILVVPEERAGIWRE